MKLALFHPAFDTVGGAEILVSEQAKLYRRNGVDVRLVSFAYTAEKWASRLDGLPVQCIPKLHWTDAFCAWTRIGKLKSRGRRASKVFCEDDVVVAHNFPCSAMLGMARTKARRIWQCNEPRRTLHLTESCPRMANLAITRTEDLSDAMREFTKRLARYNADLSKKRGVFYRREFDLTFCAHLDEIYAISEFSRDNARTIYGRCREEVIYPIVRFPEGGHTRRGLDRSGLKILVHGRLEIFKNVDTVIRGFARFFAQHSGAHLHVVGEGPHRKRLENLAVELAPGGATFHGFLPDERLREIYEVCDVFALLPLDEPFGMVFPEAAAKGLLLVGPDHGGPLEILDGGRLGWVCNPFSPEELAGIFDRIWALDDAEVDRRRIEADYACRSRYSESAVTPKLMDVLKR